MITIPSWHRGIYPLWVTKVVAKNWICLYKGDTFTLQGLMSWKIFEEYCGIWWGTPLRGQNKPSIRSQTTTIHNVGSTISLSSSNFFFRLLNTYQSMSSWTLYFTLNYNLVHAGVLNIIFSHLNQSHFVTLLKFSCTYNDCTKIILLTL